MQFQEGVEAGNGGEWAKCRVRDVGDIKCGESVEGAQELHGMEFKATAKGHVLLSHALLHRFYLNPSPPPALHHPIFSASPPFASPGSVQAGGVVLQVLANTRQVSHDLQQGEG